MLSRSQYFRAVISGLLLLLLAGCSKEPKDYQFTLSIAGGPIGWPVWVKDLTFDHAWSSPAGYLGGGYDQRPPGGATVVLDPKPAPESLQAKWFSYRTQTFYEIDLSLPTDLDGQLQDWYRSYPPPKYNHYLIPGFSGKGEVLVWWRARCMDCGYDRSEDFSTPIIEGVKSQVVEGDPEGYRVQTQELIEEGTIPSPW